MEMSARKPLLPRRVLDLPIDALRPNPNQPRIEFDEASLRSLSDSIRRYGILQPLTVRRTDEGYELIAGERRLRAAKLAGLREVPCLLARSSEAHIEELLKLKQKTPPPRLPTYIVKDVRIFLNTIRHSLGLMQRAGVEADMQREDTDDGILLTIRIPKRAKEAG